MTTDNDVMVGLFLDDLLIEVLAMIFGYLPLKYIMSLRPVCKTWREAVKKTIVPLAGTIEDPCRYVEGGKFRVDSVVKYNAMNVMATELPNLQQLKISHFGSGQRHKYNDGEDPNEEEAAKTADCISHDIGIISNFSKLRVLEIFCEHTYTAKYPILNGRYPFLFNSFPLLQKLQVRFCSNLKFDLTILAGMPMLKVLNCYDNRCLTGNMSSLRVLKDTLEKVHIGNCGVVEGHFMVLADFPHLKDLDLRDVAVTGDIRDIGENDFKCLEYLILPHGVYGGSGYELQRTSDGPDIVNLLYRLKLQRPALDLFVEFKIWCGILSRDSPDWYESFDTAPFYIEFVQAGSRLGYRWTNNFDRGSTCEVNWLGPEPDRGSSDCEQYIQELQWIERRINVYSGFYQPPTEEEYDRIPEHERDRLSWMRYM